MFTQFPGFTSTFTYFTKVGTGKHVHPVPWIHLCNPISPISPISPTSPISPLSPTSPRLEQVKFAHVKSMNVVKRVSTTSPPSTCSPNLTTFTTFTTVTTFTKVGRGKHSSVESCSPTLHRGWSPLSSPLGMWKNCPRGGGGKEKGLV